MSDGPHFFGVPTWSIPDVNTERDALRLIYAARDILGAHAEYLRLHSRIQGDEVAQASAERMALLGRIVDRLRIILVAAPSGDWAMANSLQRWQSVGRRLPPRGGIPE